MSVVSSAGVLYGRDVSFDHRRVVVAVRMGVRKSARMRRRGTGRGGRRKGVGSHARFRIALYGSTGQVNDGVDGRRSEFVQL